MQSNPHERRRELAEKYLREVRSSVEYNLAGAELLTYQLEKLVEFEKESLRRLNCLGWLRLESIEQRHARLRWRMLGKLRNADQETWGHKLAVRIPVETY
eukprot:Lithocolla_globosa_v1_NODE_210_length_5154_cov_15.452834.p6 type:complete len:100 gc:universal NODE_210_length_5154_cov_15.452834:356-57(-)